MGLFSTGGIIGGIVGGVPGAILGSSKAGKGIMDTLTGQSNYQAVGSPLSDDERKRYAEQILKAQQASDDTQYREMLNNQMQGRGPSVADMFQAKAANDAAQNAMAYANSARGDINPALLQRNAQKNAMAAQAQGNQQAAIMKQQEALNAAQLFGQNRAQNLGQEQFYQNLGMQGDMANQNSFNSVQGINAGIAQNNAANQQKFYGGVIQGASQAAMMASDENLKKDVKPGGASIEAFLDALSAHKYSYKDKSYGEGEFVSPMAQELEKTPIGDSMVVDTPQGKMVDYGKGFGAVLAAQAHLNKKLKELEKKNG